MKFTDFIKSREDLFSNLEVALYKEFERSVLFRGNMILVPIENAENFVKRLRDSLLAVAGIEVFKDSDAGLTPVDISDYSESEASSWKDFQLESIRLSLEFLKIQNNSEKVFLEFTLIRESEWRDSEG
ncbi:MAG: hypothetical protein CME70_03725 [Halobacteriovorax sp.]|nr:hypothetical protein [Halobacteriovorax sp.]|tara:strand:- start:63 stop:446 length:384 start_codon:yes stop_codon:yes gene_type:complete